MKHPIRRRFMYLGFQGLRALIQWLPLGVARALGRWLGLLAYAILPGQRRLTEAHLSYALGETLTSTQRRRIACDMFRNLGQTAMEWLVLPRLSEADLQRLITSEGVEHVRQALARGHGAILVGAHFGNWELVPLYLRSLGFEGAVLARRLRYPEYESFLITLRSSRGVATFARGSLKDVAKLLRSNQLFGILPDQDVDSLEGVFVNFFGHPAHTLIGPAALSLMTGAPILPCFMIREGARFRLVIEPAVTAPSTTGRTQAIAQLTQAWSERMESYIRRYPDHWTWMHRRWKTQPPQDSNRPHESSSHGPMRMIQPAVTLTMVATCVSLMTLLGGCGKSSMGQSTQHGSDKTTKSSTTDSKTALPAADSQASQQMSGFTLTGYQVDGSKRWQLDGKGASVDVNIVTVHEPDAMGYDPGRTAHLTASVAQINQTNRHVRLEQDVTIHTSDGLWFTSPVLHWIPDQNQVATDLPVRIETDHMLLRGRGLSGFTQLKHATIFQDIELVLNPSNHELPIGGAKQVIITCDGPLSFDYEHNVATFEQNVHVHDPNGELFSDKLVAYLDQASHTIRYADAMGHVRIYQNHNTASSERAVYEPTIGKITLVGKPSLLLFPSSKEGEGPQLSFDGLGTTEHASHPSSKKSKFLSGEQSSTQ